MLCLKWKPLRFALWPSIHHVPERAEAEQRELRIYLQSGESRSFVASVNWKLRCESGQAWLTQSDDICDYILRAGEKWQAARRSHVVLQALDDVEAVVTSG
jgi:hypothetical protein